MFFPKKCGKYLLGTAAGPSYLPTPEISPSFSSCIASAVLVMSMDDMDSSSLSTKSAVSGVITATSESEKPWGANTGEEDFYIYSEMQKGRAEQYGLQIKKPYF